MFQGDMRTVLIIQHLEKKTAYKAGKGEKTKPCIKVLQDVPEGDVPKHIESDNNDCPKLTLFMSGDSVEMAALCGDGKTIYLTKKINRAVLSLLASYYVFDIGYPRRYEQLLAFLQETVVKHSFKPPKGSSKTKGYTEMHHMVMQ